MKINYHQLAFILDIDPIDALKKIIFIHCKLLNIDIPRSSNLIRDYVNKDSKWPSEMELCQLSDHGNMPYLPLMVEQIQNKYLKNSASKKYILCDYPEKELKTKPKNKIKIPAALASLLKEEDINFIKSQWNKRYGI